MKKGTPVPAQLKARLQRALDHGLTQTQLVALADFGPTSGQNVGRALQGSPLNIRTTRALTRAVEAFERSKGYGPEAQAVVAPPTAEDDDDIFDLFAEQFAPYEAPAPRVEKRPIPAELGEELLLGLIQQAEAICTKWDHPQWRRVLALMCTAKSEI